MRRRQKLIHSETDRDRKARLAQQAWIVQRWKHSRRLKTIWEWRWYPRWQRTVTLTVPQCVDRLKTLKNYNFYPLQAQQSTQLWLVIHEREKFTPHYFTAASLLVEFTPLGIHQTQITLTAYPASNPIWGALLLVSIIPCSITSVVGEEYPWLAWGLVLLSGVWLVVILGSYFVSRNTLLSAAKRSLLLDKNKQNEVL